MSFIMIYYFKILTHYFYESISIGLFNRKWSDEEDEVDPGIAQDRRVSLRSICDNNVEIIKVYSISKLTIT